MGGERQIRERMLPVLLVKAIIEIGLLAGIASYAGCQIFHPGVRGTLDLVEAERVAGWAYDPATPNDQVEVQLFIDGRFEGAQTASMHRPDLVRAGATPSPDHGFEFRLAPIANGTTRRQASVLVLREGPAGIRVLIPLTPREKSFFRGR